MYDMLPFPNLSGGTAEEQVAQINNYLIQFKETLEFVLANISIDNLSQDLVDKLNTLGADLEKSIEDISADDITTITADDIVLPEAKKQETRRIGFC